MSTTKDDVPSIADLQRPDQESKAGFIDAKPRMSYRDYARERPDPVITVAQLMERKRAPKIKKREQVPNMEIKQVVMWEQPLKEAPPKPERIAATVHSTVIWAPPEAPVRPTSIANIEPKGRG